MRLAADRTGATYVENVLVLVLVALIASASWMAIGTSTSERVRCTARALAGHAGPCSSVARTDRSLQASSDSSVAAARASLTSSSSSPSSTSSTSGASAFEDEVASTVRGAVAHFDALAGGGDRITESTLREALSSRDAEVRSTAAHLLAQPSLRNAIDVGSGGGSVDGEIGETDLAFFYGSLAEEDLRDILADTAGGRAGNDGHVSADDLRALAADTSVPDELRAWAAARLANGEYDDDGCGWNVLCVAYRVGRGFVGRGVDTVVGLAQIGKAIVTDPIGSVRALGSAIVHPTKIWRFGEAVVGSIWNDVRAAARGDLDAIGGLGFDVVLTLATGGAGKLGKLAKARLLARHADDAARVVDDAARVAALQVPSSVDDLASHVGQYAGGYSSVVERWTTVRHAFGDAYNPIQLSWEFEGQSNNILRFYRPASLSDAQWSAMRIEERAAYGGAYGSYVRMDGAPPYLARLLQNETDVIWETTTDTYATTVGELFDQAAFVQQNLGPGYFHWHVSFRGEPRHADEVADFLAQGNEATALRLFGESPQLVHHPVLAPYASDRLASIRYELGRGFGPDAKYTTFAIRSGLYGEEGRIGYEIRAIGNDLGDAARAVDSTVRFLEDPEHTTIRLGTRGRGYRVSEAGGVDRLGDAATKRFSPEVQGFMYDAYVAAGGHPYHAERWAMPMVEWESRSYLSGIAPEIRAARADFVAGMERLAARGVRDPALRGAAAADEIEILVYRWARATRLWEHF